MHNLSHDQHKALENLVEWYKKDKESMQYVTLGGYAGTGKTTLIAFLRKQLKKIEPEIRVAFVSYTGKATRVLKHKLQFHEAVQQKDSVSTIHSLIYSPLVDENEEIVGWKAKKKLECDLIIIDEASMVDQTIWRQLISYGIPIIAVGDHGQLPPINGMFSLMQKPDLQLVEIHRQARGNPIISLSIQVRENGYIEPKMYSDTVQKYSRDDINAQEKMTELLSMYSSDMLILCGYNYTRKRLNTQIRQSRGVESPLPEPNDHVICLRNNHKKQIFNGMRGIISTIEHSDDDWFHASITMEGEEKEFTGLISRHQFNACSAVNFTKERKKTMSGDLFDFGYALTVHKAQGSQAQKVVLFEERFKEMNNDQWKRWLYTAVTRAEEELYVFGR